MPIKQTLDRGGLVYPKASFADLFHIAEKLFQDSVSCVLEN